LPVSTLRESIAATDDLKVDPTIMHVVGEIIFVDKFLRDVGELDSHIFGTVHWCHQVEIGNVEACKFRISSREHAIDDELNQIQRCCGSPNVTRVTDAISSNCYSCSMRVVFLLSVLTHHFGVGDFTTSVKGNVVVINDVECSRSFSSLLERTFRAGSNALTQSSKFVGI
jgi:hypothetical protein